MKRVEFNVDDYCAIDPSKQLHMPRGVSINKLHYVRPAHNVPLARTTPPLVSVLPRVDVFVLEDYRSPERQISGSLMEQLR
jgi:hypothetical protein